MNYWQTFGSVSHTYEHLPSCVFYNRKETEKICFMQALVYFKTQVQIIFTNFLLWQGPFNQGSDWSQGIGQNAFATEALVLWA